MGSQTRAVLLTHTDSKLIEAGSWYGGCLCNSNRMCHCTDAVTWPLGHARDRCTRHTHSQVSLDRASAGGVPVSPVAPHKSHSTHVLPCSLCPCCCSASNHRRGFTASRSTGHLRRRPGKVKMRPCAPAVAAAACVLLLSGAAATGGEYAAQVCAPRCRDAWFTCAVCGV